MPTFSDPRDEADYLRAKQVREAAIARAQAAVKAQKAARAAQIAASAPAPVESAPIPTPEETPRAPVLPRFVSGQVTIQVANVPQPLLTPSMALPFTALSVTVKPGATNSATIYLGSSGVGSTNGFPIAKADAPVTFYDVPLGSVYVTGAYATDVLCWAAVPRQVA
jgi:hypothetical protein